MFAWTKILAAVVIGSALLAAPAVAAAQAAKDLPTPTKVTTGAKSKNKTHRTHGSKHTPASKTSKAKPAYAKGTAKKGVASSKSGHKSVATSKSGHKTAATSSKSGHKTAASSKKLGLKSSTTGWKHHKTI